MTFEFEPVIYFMIAIAILAGIMAYLVVKNDR